MDDPWQGLRKFTAARIALGRAGSGIPVRQWLQFKLAHAHARDAVYSELNGGALVERLTALHLPVVQVYSQAATKEQYLQRPDLGRLLRADSLKELESLASPCDVNVVIADGLCAAAVNQNAVPLLEHLNDLLKKLNLRAAPVCVAKGARVALGDGIGAALQSSLVVMLIGERPGLSATDSIGAYITFGPKPGTTDEARNCVSNIRPGGLPVSVAAEKIAYIVREALRRKLTGVQLKDDFGLLE